MCIVPLFQWHVFLKNVTMFLGLKMLHVGRLFWWLSDRPKIQNYTLERGKKFHLKTTPYDKYVSMRVIQNSGI